MSDIIVPMKQFRIIYIYIYYTPFFHNFIEHGADIIANLLPVAIYAVRTGQGESWSR